MNTRITRDDLVQRLKRVLGGPVHLVPGGQPFANASASSPVGVGDALQQAATRGGTPSSPAKARTGLTHWPKNWG
jgi:hypothetical protein